MISPKTIPDNKGSTIFVSFWYKKYNYYSKNNYTIIDLIIRNYLNPTAACHTKANNKKKTGIIGNTSTIGLKATYASGKRDNKKVSINKKYKFVYTI